MTDRYIRLNSTREADTAVSIRDITTEAEAKKVAAKLDDDYEIREYSYFNFSNLEVGESLWEVIAVLKHGATPAQKAGLILRAFDVFTEERWAARVYIDNKPTTWAKLKAEAVRLANE